MMTGNLQEIVSGLDKKPANGMSEYDILLRHSAKPEKLPDIAQKESLPEQELQVMEKPVPDVLETTRSVATIKMPEAELISEYHPESEEALIDYVNSQNGKLEMANILVKWEIGRSINSFYQGKYGDHELNKISKKTGIGTNSLHKMCRFARIYTAEQLQLLLKGHYTLTWLDIAQNLAVEPVSVIHTFELSKSYDDFLIQIKRLKDPDEKRGKSKLSKCAETKLKGVENPGQSNVAPTEITITASPEKVAEESIMVTSEIISVKSIPSEHDGHAENIDPDELAQQHNAYEKEFTILKMENEQLRKEIADRDQQIDSMNAMMKENDRDMKDKDLLLAAYRDRIKRVRYMIENNFGVGAIMELLVVV
jgi:hypothetical protein